MWPRALRACTAAAQRRRRSRRPQPGRSRRASPSPRRSPGRRAAGARARLAPAWRSARPRGRRGRRAPGRRSQSSAWVSGPRGAGRGRAWSPHRDGSRVQAAEHPWATEEGNSHKAALQARSWGWGGEARTPALGSWGRLGFACRLQAARLSCGLQSCGQRPGLLLPEEETLCCLESGQAWELAKDGDSAWGVEGLGEADVRTHFPIVSSWTQMAMGRFSLDGGGSLFWGGLRTCWDGLEGSFPDQEIFLSSFLGPAAGEGRKELNPLPTWLFIYLDEGGRP